MRAIAFLAIFLLHCGIGQMGVLGVSVFIILSGFLLVYNNDGKLIGCSLKICIEFARKRIKKLYPLHLLMLCMALPFSIDVIIDVGSLAGVADLLRDIVANLLLVQSWIPSSRVYFSLNGVAWYLSTIAFLYAVFPCVLQFKKNFGSMKNFVC